MEKRLGTVTLGVHDLTKARRFYKEGLGWMRDGGESDIAFYDIGLGYAESSPQTEGPPPHQRSIRTTPPITS